MTFLLALKAVLASKVVAVGAGTALVAGGLAVAAPDTFLLEPASSDEVVAGEEEPTTEEGPEEPLVETEEPEDTSVEEPVEVVDEEQNTEEESCPEVTDEGVIDEGVTTDEVDGSCEVELPIEDGESSEEVEEDVEEEADERSQTAKDVHRALTATDENPEGLSPGDEGFGQAVAANAKARGGNGKAVSEAARGKKHGDAVDGEDEGDGTPETGDATPETGEELPTGEDTVEDELTTQSSDGSAGKGNGNGKGNGRKG
jgi:hypothetical protein